MQNYQNPIKVVSGRLRNGFNQMLLAEGYRPTIQPVIIKPQMPTFQIELFVKQIIERHLLVKLQLIPATAAGQVENIVGTLMKTQGQRFILKTNTNLTYVIRQSQIRYIEQV